MRKDRKLARLVANQIHQFLLDQEEARCQALELEANDGKSVKRKIIGAPWTRATPQTLCQDPDLLVMVSEYDYDLSNQEFKDFCNDRGVLNVAGTPDSEYWGFMSNYNKSKNDFLSNAILNRPSVSYGNQHQYSARELDVFWRIILIGRAKLQDCWEIYTGNCQTKISSEQADLFS